MSESDKDDTGGENVAMNTECAETSNNLHVNDFIKYSDSVDERMMEIAKCWKDPRQTSCNNWDRRGDFFDDEPESNSEEEAIPFSVVRERCTAQDEDFETGITSRDSVFDRKYAHYRQMDPKKEGMPVNGNASPRSVENLVRKFNAIELLRKKDNLRNAHESETSKPSCSAARACQQSKESQEAINPEAILGRKRKKHRDTSNERERTSEDLDKTLPQEEVDDREIDEIVQLLSSSLIKDYDENLAFPKDDDEILKTFLKTEEEEILLDSTNQKHMDEAANSMHYMLDNIDDSETQDTSKNQHVDDISDWKADTSEDLCSIFDGYDIDNPSSFHDWMIDDILSRPLKSLRESESTLCITCFTYHDSERACFQE